MARADGPSAATDSQPATPPGSPARQTAVSPSRSMAMSTTRAADRSPRVDFDHHPIMRLVIKILHTHFTNLSGSDRLEIFNKIFQKQLSEYGFPNGGIAYYDILDSQWRERVRERSRDKWLSILKEPHDMCVEELWAYVWLYDTVNGVRADLNLDGAVRPLLHYAEGASSHGFNFAIDIGEEVKQGVHELLAKTEVSTVRRRDGVECVAIKVVLPEEWAGDDDYFYCGERVEQRSQSLASHVKASWEHDS